jgi:hypothetical protein
MIWQARRVGHKVALLVVCAILLWPGCALRDTPRYSLEQLKTALVNHDAETALRYIDVESVVDRFIKEKLSDYGTRTDDPLGLSAVVRANDISAFAKPIFVRMGKEALRKAVTSDDPDFFNDLRRVSVWYFSVTNEGETALVEPRFKSNVKFRMARGEDDHWKIIEIIRD